MNSYKIAEERTDALLMKWATRFFGSWLKALDAAGVPAVVRSKPVRKIPLAPVPLEKYLNQIRARAAAGLSLRIKDMHGRICEGGNIGLTAVCRKRFGSWKKALEAAGISVIPDATKRRSYRTVKAVIAELRRRHEAGFSLQPTALLRGPNCDRTLLKAIGKLYPDYSAALEAAGLPLPPSIEPAKPLHSKTQENQ